MAHRKIEQAPGKSADVLIAAVQATMPENSTLTSKEFRESQKHRGSITVITGPMFSGKTTKLIELYNTLVYQGAQGIAILSEMDNRYAAGPMRTHDGITLPARKFRKLYPDDPTWKIHNLIAIDEAQFFWNISSFCDEMALRGKTVLVTTINSTYTRDSFPHVADLIAKADAVHHLFGRCEICGDRAIATKRKEPAAGLLVAKGSDLYQPLCRVCFCKARPETGDYITKALCDDPEEVTVDTPEDPETFHANMHNELKRLATYTCYPKTIPSPEELARDGFYYLGVSDHVKCASCSLVVHSWEESDIPAMIHRNFSPACDMLHPKQKLLLNTAEHTYFVNTLSLIACEWKDHFLPADHVRSDHQSWLRSLVHQIGGTYVFSRYKQINEKQPWYPTVEKSVCKFRYTRSEQQLLLDMLRGNLARSATFHGFPCGQSVIFALIKEGFFNVNYRNSVQCAFCLLMLRDIDNSSDPAELHAKHSPQCPMVKCVGPLFGNHEVDLNNALHEPACMLCEPLHNPSNRRDQIIQQMFNPWERNHGGSTQYVPKGSEDAFSENLPIMFQDPHCFSEMQAKASNYRNKNGKSTTHAKPFTGDICPNHTPDSWKTDTSVFLCCQPLTPEIAAQLKLAENNKLIESIPIKEHSKVFSSINTLQTLVDPIELGWDPFFDEAFWVSEQEKDRDVVRLISNVKKGKEEPFHAVGADGILYHLSGTIWVVVVPTHLKRYVTWAFHDTPIMGHYGPEKTLQRMKQHVYFSGMHAYVAEYIKTCIKCQLYKKRLGGRVQYQCTNVPPDIFHTISMDLVGPYPTSLDGFSYIMVVQDVLTRYLFILPLKGKTAEEISDNLVEHVFLKVGPPTRLLSDNAKEFHSTLLRRLSDTFGYKRLFVQTYRPQQNGANERSHAELYRWLKMYMYDAETTQCWPMFKNLLAYTYNTTPHSTLGGKSPFELIFGRKPPLQPFGWPTSTKPSDVDFVKFLGLRDEQVQAIRAETRKVIEFNMRTSLERANRRLSAPDFLIGDDVLELEFKVQPKVITQKKDWRPTYQVRPLKITEVISDAHVRVRDDLGIERILHVDRLKRLQRRDGCIGFSGQPPKPLNDENFFDDSDEEDAQGNIQPREGIEHLLRTSDPTPEERVITNNNPNSNNNPEPANEGIARIASKKKRFFPESFYAKRSNRHAPKKPDGDFVPHGPEVNVHRTRTPQKLAFKLKNVIIPVQRCDQPTT
jgi:thymidine kinase